jgi:hypothetical protein
MNYLFALQGRHDCGKTETLNNVIQLLTNKYPNANLNVMISGKDQKVIFKNINGLTIGIETQGDPNSRLEQSLSDFLNANCDIIFCACRTSGMTVNWISSLSKRYKIQYIKQTIVNNNYSKNNLNKANLFIQLSGL